MELGGEPLGLGGPQYQAPPRDQLGKKRNGPKLRNALGTLPRNNVTPLRNGGI